MRENVLIREPVMLYQALALANIKVESNKGVLTFYYFGYETNLDQ